ncbi:virulence factor TspB C-terminal domain-related protein [Aeromonas hydrophila]|uniref:virulence factor TspB C-terminal domain-related protein n=1 Tax=Aeromonas hydrophila TaxID=644 RepID=UPI0016247E59|nr:virulence factor TspB C-terminal domain-related protein [Aeromonas hydrophila]
MITKSKAIIFALLFSALPAFAGYTTMTIDAVQQANGVWTAAGVMDSMGFVRTTGAVSVLGSTKNVPVAFAADISASSAILRAAGRALGPASLALAAYDVYEFFGSNDVKPCGEAWCTAVNGSFHPTSVLGNCQLANPYNGQWSIVPDYTPEKCVSQNVTNLSNTTYIASFAGWISAAKLTTQYQYQARYLLKRRSDGVVVDSYDRYWYGPINAIPVSEGTPVTDADFNKMPNFPLPVLSNGFNNVPSLKDKPIPINGSSTSFTPFSVWQGEPYFKDGSWYRDRMDISPCPTASQPTRVCVDIGPQKFEGATDPQTIPSQATGTASGSNPKENADFCKKNPQSIACAELGELEDESLEVDERPVNVSYTPWGSSNSQCPADKIIPLWEGHTLSLSWSPICQFAYLLRPLVIALAFVAAGFIVAGVTRKGGGDS